MRGTHAGYLLGVDVGGTAVKVGVFTADGELCPVYSRYYQVYTGLYPDLAARYAQLWRAQQ